MTNARYINNVILNGTIIEAWNGYIDLDKP